MNVKKVIRYNQLPNGIHEFIFLTDKREAIDIFFDMIGELFECSPKNRTVRYTIDWSHSGAPSLNYMFLRAKEFGRKHRDIPAGRGVLIFDQKGFLPIGRALVMLIKRDWGDRFELMLEHNDKRDDAIAWLLVDHETELARR